MKFDYFDMLSGYPIYVSGVGHVKSPKLKEICPTVGTGHWVYTLFLSALSWDKEDVFDYLKVMKFRGENKLHRDEFTVFDIISLVTPLQDLYKEILGFFISELVDWDPSRRMFITSVEDENGQSSVGQIDRDNFETVRDAIRQMNFIGLDKSAAEPKFASEKAKELWERAQQYLRQQKTTGDAKYRLNNIISKLCAAHPSYNFTNIFELTIFQLYDAFFEYGYIRSAGLSEAIFSNHGGDHFNFEEWLKPIL